MISFLCKNSSSSSITVCFLVDGCGNKVNNVGPFSVLFSFSTSGLSTSIKAVGSENVDKFYIGSLT